MSPELNPIAKKLGASPTMSAAQADGNAINLAMGEPAEPPAEDIVEATVDALRRGDTRYGPVAGLPELRERLAGEHAGRSGLETTGASVIVTAGGKPALLGALACVLEPADEVLVLAPYWPTFLQQIEICGASPVVIPATDDLGVDPGRVKAACNERTRALIVNSPSNPSSLAIDSASMAELVELAVRHDLWLLSDEVYRDIGFEGPTTTPLSVRPDARQRIVVIDSFSKRFAMTGLRLGSAIGPEPLISAMIRMASATTTHPSTPSQHAGIAALNLDGSWERAQRDRYRKRRDTTSATLEALGARLSRLPDAAFYLFPDVASWMDAARVEDDQTLCRRLREEAGVALVPGSAFGTPRRVRISCGASDDLLAEAMERIRRWLETAEA